MSKKWCLLIETKIINQFFQIGLKSDRGLKAIWGVMDT